jgi:hypothetical protein
MWAFERVFSFFPFCHLHFIWLALRHTHLVRSLIFFIYTTIRVFYLMIFTI